MAQECGLTNIIDQFSLPPLLDAHESGDLFEEACLLVREYVQANPLDYMYPDFHNRVVSSVAQVMHIQLAHLEEDIDLEIQESVLCAMSLFYTYECPRRSYKQRSKVKTRQTQGVRDRISYLMTVPQPEQRTEEWYEYRHNRLSASTAWKALGTQSSRNHLIYEKAAPYKAFSGSVGLDSSLHHGVKFEPVSIAIYEKDNDTVVTDYGAIPHDTVPFLAASPDGINTKEGSPLYGRMLEVKNIVNREITGIPKLDYWVQMQIQMEVCKLNTCDFLETRFIEYESRDAFLADGTFTKTSKGKRKGILLLFSKEGDAHYEYPPIDMEEEEFAKWEAARMKENGEKGMTWISNVHWRLDQLSCVAVRRNKLWFNAALPMFTSLWETVLTERKTGYEHRAPKRKPRTKSLTDNQPIGCMIDISTLDLPKEEKRERSKSENIVIVVETDTTT